MSLFPILACELPGIYGSWHRKKLVQKLPGSEVYFVYTNQDGKYEVFFSEGMKKMIVEQK